MNGYAVALGLSTALVAGLVGSLALMKRMTLAGDVVSHLALPGLALAFLLKIHPLLGAAATLAVGILLIDRLERRSGLATESVIGVVFVAALAIGTLLTPREDLIEALFGGWAETTREGLVTGLAGCLVVAGLILTLRDRLMLIIFSPDLAKSIPINVDRVNRAYLCAFGLTILLGLQVLGALLVGALIIVPAAVGRRLAGTFNGFLVASAASSVISAGVGFLVAARWHLAPGPTIVAVASLIFGASLLGRR
jgi:zinc transport system permease protein